MQASGPEAYSAVQDATILRLVFHDRACPHLYTVLLYYAFLTKYMEAFHFFVCILFYFMRDTIFFQKIVKYFAKAVGFLMVDDSDTETAPQDVARAGGHRRVALLPSPVRI